MTSDKPYLILQDACLTALFGVTADATNNGGKVDRRGIAETLRDAITAAAIYRAGSEAQTDKASRN